ncbi:MAG TPA: ABC transporter permease [Opitutaceae bacterium]|nr:ABC transporter permease [Opitutaceae bacterium]
MSRARVGRGLVRHFSLTLRLNFRSRQAILYGYLVPVLFLVAFGGIFRGDTPPLRHEMGMLLTIGVLGGACFGLPTALVSERERGLWRRYRLLPASTGSLLAATLLARLVLLASAALMQIVLARLIYGTPLPVNPAQELAAFLLVAFSFLGLGLLVAALADDVPAVQALGQCLFLPMIMLGGVGVPLAVLPAWAQEAAGFMPGRYAVEALQRGFSDPRGLHGAGFSLSALAVIGAAAGAAGARLFRWDAGRHTSRPAIAWVLAALLAWAAVGAAASMTGRLAPAGPGDDTYGSITEAQIEGITYDDLPGDNEFATRLAPPLAGAGAEAMSGFAAALRAWAPGRDGDPAQCVRNLLSVASSADVTANTREAEIARVVFDLIRERYARGPLVRILAWIILHPDEGGVVARAPELGLERYPPESIIRERNALYAKKLMGRILGKIPE